MEIPSSKWLPEWEMEDPTLFSQYQMNPMDYCFDDNLNFQSFSSESHSSFSNINPEMRSKNISSSYHIEASQVTEEDIKRPVKQLKTCNSSWESSCVGKQITSKPSASASSQIISFENSKSSPAISQQYYGDLDHAVNYKNESTKRVGSMSRSPLHAQDHVIAERKRREKLSQRFIALSALLPGLKKADKASVLGDAIKYVKQLQERVQILEEQVAKKTVESVIFVKKTQIYADDETSSSDENFDCQPTHSSLPEIEARVSDRDVLIRIHCEKTKGFLTNILNEIEKRNLSVVGSNVLPFGRTTVDITIAAQMDDEFSITANDLVKSIRLALKN
ncbi:hypothetical protein SLA2020_205930 [Shorea laevis]